MAVAELERHLTEARELIQELDSAAQQCVLEDSQDSCKAFASTLDELFIPAYLQHCDAISEWRDQLLENREAGTEMLTAEQDLARQLLDAEFTCGEDALAKRSQYVVTAFQKWQQEESGTALLAPHAARQSASNANNGSNSTSQALRSQQSRLTREIERQWQRVELQNIRQQLRKPIDYGDYNYLQ